MGRLSLVGDIEQEKNGILQIVPFENGGTSDVYEKPAEEGIKECIADFFEGLTYALKFFGFFYEGLPGSKEYWEDFYCNLSAKDLLCNVDVIEKKRGEVLYAIYASLDGEGTKLEAKREFNERATMYFFPEVIKSCHKHMGEDSQEKVRAEIKDLIIPRELLIERLIFKLSECGVAPSSMFYSCNMIELLEELNATYADYSEGTEIDTDRIRGMRSFIEFVRMNLK